MIFVSRQYWFSASHRLNDHPLCGRLHGHNYKLNVTLGGATLNERGMLVDFKEIDAWMAFPLAHLDHHHLISWENMQASCPYAATALKLGDGVVVGSHSTVEVIAQNLFDWLSVHQLGDGIEITDLELWETHRSRVFVQGHSLPLPSPLDMDFLLRK